MATFIRRMAKTQRTDESSLRGSGTAGRAEISAPVVVRGPLYVPVACDCGVPPWEVCKHSFPEYLDADGNPKRESA